MPEQDVKADFTTISHPVRQALGLNIIEYCICDMIYGLERNKKGPGRCWASDYWFADKLGVSERTVRRALKKLEQGDLIKVEHNVFKNKKRYYRLMTTLPKWYDHFDEDPEKIKSAGQNDHLKEDEVDKDVKAGGQNDHDSRTNCPTYKNKDNNNYKNKTTKKHVQLTEDEFEQLFWQYYPKKKAKKDAFKAFKQMVAPRGEVKQELLQTILADIEARKSTPDWQEQGGKFIPLAGTYLRGERWEDEIDPGSTTEPNVEPTPREVPAEEPATPEAKPLRKSDIDLDRFRKHLEAFMTPGKIEARYSDVYFRQNGKAVHMYVPEFDYDWILEEAPVLTDVLKEMGYVQELRIEKQEGT